MSRIRPLECLHAFAGADSVRMELRTAEGWRDAEIPSPKGRRLPVGLRRRKVFVWNPKWAAVLGRLWQLRGLMPKRHGLQSIRSNEPIPRPPERVGLAKWTQGELR